MSTRAKRNSPQSTTWFRKIVAGGFPFSLALFLIASLHAAENSVALNIEPSKEFPRNSEGSFVTLRSGRILFLYTQFYGGAEALLPSRLLGPVTLHMTEVNGVE